MLCVVCVFVLFSCCLCGVLCRVVCGVCVVCMCDVLCVACVHLSLRVYVWCVGDELMCV